MDKTNKILIIVVIILIGVIAVAAGYFLQGNLTRNTNVTNQTNISINNSNNNASNDQTRNDVPYRIESNTPDCPNCGSNNIAQLADSIYDNSTDEWLVLSKCRYCGYEWTFRSPNLD